MWPPVPFARSASGWQEIRLLTLIASYSVSLKNSTTKPSSTKVPTRGEGVVTRMLIQHGIPQIFVNGTNPTLYLRPLLREQLALMPVCVVRKNCRDGLAEAKLLANLYARRYNVRHLGTRAGGGETSVSRISYTISIHHLRCAGTR